MAVEPETSLKSAARRRLRGARPAVLAELEELFKGRFHQEAARDIAERVVLRSFNRGQECFNGWRDRRIFILTSGCMREDIPGGAVRLWREGTVFGDWTRDGVPKLGTRGILRSGWGGGLFIGIKDVHQIVARHPEFAVALADLTAERLRITETVYGASKLSPAVRVAKLLLYLADDSVKFLHARDSSGRTVVRSAPVGHVHGPTQADIADSLGLGRATVEKVCAALRENGILEKPEPGARRSNASYKIADRWGLLDIIRERRSLTPRK